MLSEIMKSFDAEAGRSNAWTLPVIFQYFSVADQLPAVAANSNFNDDAYLLVMLADQELNDGRAEQALELLDAAYAAFDQMTLRA